MDNKIELTDWEILALQTFHVKLENGAMSSLNGKEKIVFKKIKFNPYLLKKGEESKGSLSNQKYELHFEGYNRHIVITRYGDIPGPLTITVGKRETYGVNVTEYQGLRSVETFYIVDNKKASIVATPYYPTPDSEDVILLTRLSSVHGINQIPKYTTYIKCSANEIRLEDQDIKKYWRSEEIDKPLEVNKYNYQLLLEEAIKHRYCEKNSYQREGYFTQDAVPFLLDAFERVEAYYCDDIMAHKIETVNVQYDAKLDAVNKERDEKVLEINKQKEREINELSEKHKALCKVKDRNRNN